MLLCSFCLIKQKAKAQITINIDFTAGGRSYSPYIFGKNNTLSDNPGKPLSYSDWIRIKDSGITIFNSSGINASTLGLAISPVGKETGDVSGFRNTRPVEPI